MLCGASTSTLPTPGGRISTSSASSSSTLFLRVRFCKRHIPHTDHIRVQTQSRTRHKRHKTVEHTRYTHLHIQTHETYATHGTSSTHIISENKIRHPTTHFRDPDRGGGIPKPSKIRKKLFLSSPKIPHPTCSFFYFDFFFAIVVSSRLFVVLPFVHTPNSIYSIPGMQHTRFTAHTPNTAQH